MPKSYRPKILPLQVVQQIYPLFFVLLMALALRLYFAIGVNGFDSLLYADSAWQLAHGQWPFDLAYVKVQFLAQRHIQRTHAAADGCGQRTLDADQELLESLQGLFGQPALEAGKGFLARIHFHPHQLALSSVGFLHGGIQHALAGAPDIPAGAVALNKRKDGIVGYVQFAVVNRDLFATLGNFHDAISHLALHYFFRNYTSEMCNNQKQVGVFRCYNNSRPCSWISPQTPA